MNQILIESGILENRIMVLKNNHLVDFLVDDKETSIIGNIYKCRVTNIVEEMFAAFVDIGLNRNAFIHKKDFINNDNFKIGKEFFVQITKEAIDEKGAKVTADISFKGKYLVLVPLSKNQIKISRKIKSKKERNRLNNIISSINHKTYGVIVRTEAENIKKELIKKDFLNLEREFEKFESKKSSGYAPQLVYESSEILLSTLYYYNNIGIDRILIDDKLLLDKVSALINEYNLINLGDLLYYDEDRSLSSRYNINAQIDLALSERVKLKSGGELVIQETEALTVIDVNSKSQIKSTGKFDFGYSINIEAAVEILNQIKLRNISGIIIVDFVEMNDLLSKKKLDEELKRIVSNDRIKTIYFGITKLGLGEFTRQRFCNSLNYYYKSTFKADFGLENSEFRRNLIKIESKYRHYSRVTNTRKIELKLNVKYNNKFLDINSIVSMLKEKYDIETEIKFVESKQLEEFSIKTQKFGI